MDFSKVLSRAWQITWRWKVLWILGFLASLGSGIGSGNGGMNYQFDSSNWDRWGYRYQFDRIPGELIALIVGLGCLAILIGIALWVISVIARGGLIAGVQQVEETESTTFLGAWRVGRKKFWTLFGISVLAAIPIIVLVIAGIAAIMGMFAVGGVLGGRSVGVGEVLFSIFCGGTFCCGLAIAVIILSQIQTYAERAAILEDMGWLDAFRRGWQVLKENLGPTIIYWLIFFALGLIIVFLIMSGVFAVAAPLIAIFSSIDPGPWLVVPLCFGGLLGILLATVVGSIITTFTSTTWTLAYREFTGLAAPATTEE
ncbi:MAG: hypothetical protein PVJ34_20595 [Anaerolineae bacterium]|jgi:hypothetical protein